MRRTLLYTAGLTIAAGASLALAGPASAAPQAPASTAAAKFCCHGQGSGFSQGRGFGQGSRFNQPSRVPARQFSPRGLGGLGGSLGTITVINQIVLNDIGNTQIGNGNYNGGGTASATSFTSQFSSILGRR
jgi:hypothetical protein